MRNHCTIILVGVSGVGKSRLASSLVRQIQDVTHVQASQLLKDALATEAEALRLGAVQNNQGILVAAFKDFRSKNQGTVILDGHAVVDGSDGLEEIPFEVFRDLAPKGFIEVIDDPESIVERRRLDIGRKRPVRTAAEIHEHQQRSSVIVSDYAIRLGVPAISVRSGNEAEAHEALRTIFATP